MPVLLSPRKTANNQFIQDDLEKSWGCDEKEAQQIRTNIFKQSLNWWLKMPFVVHKPRRTCTYKAICVCPVHCILKRGLNQVVWTETLTVCSTTMGIRGLLHTGLWWIHLLCFRVNPPMCNTRWKDTVFYCFVCLSLQQIFLGKKSFILIQTWKLSDYWDIDSFCTGAVTFEFHIID